jgi:hypothetical protein
MDAQKMKNTVDNVKKLFIATDERGWLKVEACFAPAALIDYSSMTGNPARKLSPNEIFSARKGLLPGFEHTHHQLENLIIEINATTASVFCYGVANYYLPYEQRELAIVVDSYDFQIKKQTNGAWKISEMKFNFKYQTGNTSLSKKAIAYVNNLNN